MRKEIVIVGIILVILGTGLLWIGFQKLQSTKTEKTMSYIKNFAEDLTGEKVKGFPKKDNTESIIFILLGSLSFVVGLIMILKSRKNKIDKFSESITKDNIVYCPKCGIKLTKSDIFCPKCGNEIR